MDLGIAHFVPLPPLSPVNVQAVLAVDCTRSQTQNEKEEESHEA